jgi:hypothetical protein
MSQQRARAHLHTSNQTGRPLKFLNASQVEMIDESLAALGDFGEVRLVVEKGRLRFVVTQCSHDALSWRPGTFKRALGN